MHFYHHCDFVHHSYIPIWGITHGSVKLGYIPGIWFNLTLESNLHHGPLPLLILLTSSLSSYKCVHNVNHVFVFWLPNVASSINRHRYILARVQSIHVKIARWWILRKFCKLLNFLKEIFRFEVTVNNIYCSKLLEHQQSFHLIFQFSHLIKHSVQKGFQFQRSNGFDSWLTSRRLVKTFTALFQNFE